MKREPVSDAELTKAVKQFTAGTLATLLGSGRSSRLYQVVREQKGLVNSADAWTYSPGNTGLIGMSAVVNADKFDASREAMLAEVERMKREPVSDAELTKAVKQFTAGTLATRKTMQGQANDLGGSWLAAGDLNFSHRYLEAVKRITPAEIQRVAREYLTPENRTLYALLPAGTAPQATLTSAHTRENEVQKFELPNGLRLLVKEDHRLPFVQFRAVFQGGVLAETPQNNGITALLAKMLLKGTQSRTAEQIVTEIESVGGSIDTYAGSNSFGVSSEVMSSDFNLGLEILADAVLHPSLPAAALENERQIQLAGLRAQRDHLLQSGGKAMRRALFGEIGYVLDAIGTEAIISKLQVPDLKAFHQKRVAPDNCVLAVFGDVKAADVRAAIEKTFADWDRTGCGQALVLPAPLETVKRVVETRDKKQAVLLIGFAGATSFDDDRRLLDLLSEACSDLGSRLFLRIREKLGLAYYVGAQNVPGLAPGYFSFYVGTAPEKLELVETELLAEARLLREEGLTAEELQRAKAKIIGQRKISRQDLGGLALTMALDELYGLGHAFSEQEDAKFEAVTLDQMKAAAQKYLRPDAMVIAIVKPGVSE